MTPRESLLAAMGAVEKWDKFCATDSGRDEQPRQLLIAATLIPLFALIRDHSPALLAALDDAERMEWFFGATGKNPDWINDYLRGVREGWTVTKWRASIDAARKP